MRASKVCLDVGYGDDRVIAACVGFDARTDASPAFATALRSETPPASYEPGQFARRELPYLLAILETLGTLPAVLVVDGYVWLGAGKPGLGAHLHDALGGRAIVIGVAKRHFHGADDAAPLLRGQSKVPLYVSAVGVALDEAVDAVRSMDGAFRVPSLLARVDRLSRDGAP